MKPFKLIALFFAISLAFVSCKEEGCMDKAADNYNEDAKEDDGSCLFSGCMDETATNFDAIANVDDGTCTYAGCMDPDGKNYNSEAVEDDGSCMYEGSVVFWWTQATASSMTAQNLNSLDFYVNDTMLVNVPTTVSWADAPLCSVTDVMVKVQNLGTVKTNTLSYKFTDPNSGQNIFIGNATFDANTCNDIELTR